MKRIRNHLRGVLIGNADMPSPTHEKKNPIDGDLQDDINEDVEHTPTEKSGDETQRNEQGSTEAGINDRSRRRRDNREDNDSP